MWKSTASGVRARSDDLDPYGLEPGKPDGASIDENGFEGGPVVRHLVRDGAITVEQVDAIWIHWSGE